jgi:hypothetical protein
LEAATYLSEVHLIEYNLIRMTDAVESSCEGGNNNDKEGKLVVPFRLLCANHFPVDLVQNVISAA